MAFHFWTPIPGRSRRGRRSLNSPLWNIFRLESSASRNINGRAEVRVHQEMVTEFRELLVKVSAVQTHIGMPGTIAREGENEEHSPKS